MPRFVTPVVLRYCASCDGRFFASQIRAETSHFRLVNGGVWSNILIPETGGVTLTLVTEPPPVAPVVQFSIQKERHRTWSIAKKGQFAESKTPYQNK